MFHLVTYMKDLVKERNLVFTSDNLGYCFEVSYNRSVLF